jgi:hypothetical protein
MSNEFFQTRSELASILQILVDESVFVDKPKSFVGFFFAEA